ncbi:hypothetical protein K435DRAFT_359505 [Dendrothele bispora CBS 962.96]|uniref:Zn(2)-C6 fungal-type domain-containing protein n=1 Tax=Dendrothele bispora (strain CBS 962.96) TaxID=1314807 RepID=A0A4S8LD28_DENBC|nr:hypothetical protein K435DRAFT_359505 [Dendrothele bispora CBS 962.96]
MPKFVSPKKARPPKAKDAVRVKSGCYTRRIRHKKCDKRPDEFGRCETCVRRHIQCLSFGAKRPDWLREINNEKIKQFLASRGMIKGHSGSPSSEQEQTLQLADDQHRTPSGSSQSTGELLLSDELPGGPLSSVRDHHEIDGIYPVCTSYPPTSYDSSPSPTPPDSDTLNKTTTTRPKPPSS